MYEASPLAERTDDLYSLGARELRLAQMDVRGPGLAAPEPNTWSTHDGVEILWLGPDQTLTIGPLEQRREILQRLRSDLAGRRSSIVDVSSMRAVIEFPDDLAAGVLPAGCGIDLDRDVWRDGSCAQTLLARLPVLLQKRLTATRLFVRASYSEWLLDWMLAVRE